ncbi:MAG: SDR family NAD(P)-dependent oxidoreductase [Sphingobium sp.]
MSIDLAGKVALVTGGNRGIGFAVADALSQAGATVAIWGRDEAGNRRAVDRLLRNGHRAVSDVVDVTDEDAVERGAMRLIERLEHIDSVFACAGIPGRATPFLDQRRVDWDAVLSVNIHGLASTMRTVVRHMIAGGRPGSLVGFGSLAAERGAAQMQAYAASKAATAAIMRALAVEFGAQGVRANIIVPGWIDTGMAATSGLGPDHDRIARRTPVRRWGRPADLASLAVYLAGDESHFMTGTTLVIDGGFSIS